MAAVERSLSDVMHDIIGNVQDMLRSEVLLAKSDIREEAVRAKSWALLIGAGAATAMFAAIFLLLTAVFCLALLIPLWGATLIVGAVLAVAAGAMLTQGAERFRRLYRVTGT